MIIVLATLGIFALTLWLTWARIKRRRNPTQDQHGLSHTEEQVWKDLVNRYHRS